MKKQFKVIVVLEADSDANFWEVDHYDDRAIVKQMVQDALYDIDDTKVNRVEVKELT